MPSMGSHQQTVMKSDTWLTPPSLLAALGRFDMDPCAAPEPRPWPTADRLVSRPADGLAVPWEGRVWLNPPYSKEARVWLLRLADHGRGTALIFARTETSWFQQAVWERASALLFLAGRVTFHRGDGVAALKDSGAPSVLVAYGDEDAGVLAGCGVPGAFVPRWEFAGRC